jgi:teichuronic acid biosynthesis glycosyltransferase TuaH
MEMLEDTVRREFCRAPDQTLLALARDERMGRLLVADPRRSYAATDCSSCYCLPGRGWGSH